MSISLHWDNAERTILCMTFDGQWTAAQFDRALELALVKIAAAHRTIFLMIAVQTTSREPGALPCCHPVAQWPDPVGGVVLVGEHPLCQRLLGSLKLDAPGLHPPARCVDNQTAAYEAITVWLLRAELRRQASR